VLAFGSDGVVAAAQADTAGLVFAAAAEYVSPRVADIMVVLLLTSLFAALLAFHNAISRYLFALGRQGVVPGALGRTHARHGSPHVGSLVQTASALLVVAVFAAAGSDPVLQLFTWMSGLATVSILLLMILTSVAVFAFFARSKVDQRAWHTRIAPVLGTLGLLGITALVLTNFTTLIGGDSALATVLLVVIAASFVAGVAVALAQRSRRPAAPATDS
jgi:amino acid transporter